MPGVPSGLPVPDSIPGLELVADLLGKLPVPDFLGSLFGTVLDLAVIGL